MKVLKKKEQIVAISLVVEDRGRKIIENAHWCLKVKSKQTPLFTIVCQSICGRQQFAEADVKNVQRGFL